jgi:hypothetical protein
VQARLPKNVFVAYDGLTIEVWAAGQADAKRPMSVSQCSLREPTNRKS